MAEQFSLLPGDIIRVKRIMPLLGYWHWAVYVGEGKVIHYTSAHSDISADNTVQQTSLSHFLRDESQFEKVLFPEHYQLEKRQARQPLPDLDSPHLNKKVVALFKAVRFASKVIQHLQSIKYHHYSAADVIARAQSRLGETNYRLFFNNCEHFALWCKTGLAQSQQTAFWQLLAEADLSLTFVTLDCQTALAKNLTLREH